MEDPYWGTKGAARVATAYPPEMRDKIGPRHMVHSWATDVDDPTVQKRWGKIGKQKIVDEGPLPPDASYGAKYNQETIDNTVRDMSLRFMKDAHKDGKPFFVWVTHRCRRVQLSASKTSRRRSRKRLLIIRATELDRAHRAGTLSRAPARSSPDVLGWCINPSHLNERKTNENQRSSNFALLRCTTGVFSIACLRESGSLTPST